MIDASRPYRPSSAGSALTRSGASAAGQVGDQAGRAAGDEQPARDGVLTATASSLPRLRLGRWAGRAVGGHGQVDQVGVDRLADAGARAVPGVAVADPGDQHAVLQLGGQGLGLA